MLEHEDTSKRAGLSALEKIDMESDLGNSYTKGLVRVCDDENVEM